MVGEGGGDVAGSGWAGAAVGGHGNDSEPEKRLLADRPARRPDAGREPDPGSNVRRLLRT